MAGEIEMLDVVELTQDFPQYGLKAGDQGAIVEILYAPGVADPMYIVEFVEEDGHTKAMESFHPEVLRRVWSAKEQKWLK